MAQQNILIRESGEWRHSNPNKDDITLRSYVGKRVVLTSHAQTITEFNDKIFLIKDLNGNEVTSIDQYGDSIFNNMLLTGGGTVQGDFSVRSNADVQLDFTVEGKSTLDHLEVLKDTLLDGSVHAISDVIIDNTLDVINKTTLHDDLIVKKDILAEGNIEGDKDLTIQGTGTFISHLISMGNLDVNGYTYLNNDTFIDKTLTVEDKTTLKGDTLLEEKLNVRGEVLLENILNVEGTSNLSSKLTVEGDTFLKSDTLISKNLEVLKDTYIAGKLDVEEETTLNSTLSVIDTVNLGNNLNVDNDTILSGNLNVSGVSHFNKSAVIESITSNLNDLALRIQGLTEGKNTLLEGWLRVYGEAYVADLFEVHGDTRLNKNLFIQEDLNLFGNGNLHANLIVDQNTLLKGELEVKKATKISDNLTVALDTVLSGILNVFSKATFYNDVDIDGSTKINSNLEVIAKSTLNDDLKVLKQTFLKDLVDILGEVYIHNNIEIDLNALIKNNLEVIGESIFNGLVKMAGELSLEGDLLVGGNTALSKELGVSGNAFFANNFYVMGNSFFNEDIQAEKNIKIDGEIFINGNSSLFNNLSVTGDIKGYGGFEILGHSLLRGNVFVDQDTVLAGTLNVGQQSIFSNKIQVFGEALFENKAIVSGDIYAGSDFYVLGESYLKNSVSIDNNLNVLGSITTDGDSFFNSNLKVNNKTTSKELEITEGSYLKGNLIVDNTSLFKDNLTIEDNINVSGNGKINGDFEILGNSKFNTVDIQSHAHLFSDLIVENDSFLKSDLTVEHNLYINGEVNSQGKVSIHDEVEVDDIATFKSNTNTIGNSYVNQALHVYGNGNFYNNISVSKNITGNGALTLQGNAFLNNNLTVNEKTTLNKDLEVIGSTYLQDNLTIDGEVIASSTFSVSGNVGVSGTLECSNDVVIHKNLEVDENSHFLQNIDVDQNLTVDGKIDGDVITPDEGNYFQNSINELEPILQDIGSQMYTRWSTGLKSGGELSILSDNRVSLSSGEGYITFGEYKNRLVSWENIPSITMVYDGANYIYMDENAQVIIQDTQATTGQRIYIGFVFTYENNTKIMSVADSSTVIQNHTHRLSDWISNAIGIIVDSGNLVSEDMTNLKLIVTGGRIYNGVKLLNSTTKTEFTKWYKTSDNGWLVDSSEENFVSTLQYNNINNSSAITLSGDVTFDGTTSVVGTNSHFTTEIAVGNYIYASSDGIAFKAKVASITDDTHLTLTSSYSGSSNAPETALKDEGLVAMTSGYWKKDLVIRTLDDKIHYIYGQYQYTDESSANDGPLPQIPDSLMKNCAFLATIVSQQGDSSINSRLHDVRPNLERIFGFGTSGTTGSVASHGSLSGLENDDHTQYLLANGSRQMSGALNLGNNPILNTNLSQGSILFIGANGDVIEKNSSLFWDNSNNFLGIGTSTPNVELEVNGGILVQNNLEINSDLKSNGDSYFNGSIIANALSYFHNWAKGKFDLDLGFRINGVDTENTVSATNLNKLTNKSFADDLHTHGANLAYDLIVADTGGDYTNLWDAIANSSDGSKILVTNNQTISTQQIISKRLEIVFNPFTKITCPVALGTSILKIDAELITRNLSLEFTHDGNSTIDSGIEINCNFGYHENIRITLNSSTDTLAKAFIIDSGAQGNFIRGLVYQQNGTITEVIEDNSGKTNNDFEIRAVS